jgi:hypothetical protein
MPNDAAREEIKALEDKRYRAMIAGDVAVLDDLCSDDLIYTHSKADYHDNGELESRDEPFAGSRTREGSPPPLDCAHS